MCFMKREELEKKYGKVWDVDEFVRDFDVRGILPYPLVKVLHKDSNKMGTVKYQVSPSYYFDWVEDVNEK